MLWFYRFLLSLGVLILSSEALEKECPHPEDSYPCYCEEEEFQSVMHCNNLEETKQIKQALQNLSNFEIDLLSVWMFDTDKIKSDTFKGPKVKAITFTHSQLFMEAPQFLGQETSLGRLTFISCFDTEDLMESWSFGHLSKLKEITFEKNDIKVLKNDWLTSFGSSLRSITFDDCKIEQLENSVFSKISTLTTIFLMNNKITSVSRSMFPEDATNLRSINLSGNKLTALPVDFFKSLTALMSIDLERNQFISIDESTWSTKIDELSRVYLDENPINCDKSLKWISKKALPKAFTGKCNKPLKLKEKEIRLLTPADFYS